MEKGKRTIGIRCKQLTILTERRISHALGDLDLTPAQSRMVNHLVCRGESFPCQRDLEEQFSLSHPTVSGILSRLEEKGYITLRADERDHRRKRIEPTEKALDCARRTGQVLENAEQDMLRGFTPEEQAQLMEFLDRAVRNLDTCPGKENQNQ